MTYLFEYTILDDNIKVEYTFSTVTDGIKVIDMWVDDKPHDVNWMSPEGNKALMARLENDMTDRMCGTGEYSSEIDLDRDMPGFEGTMETLNGITV